MNSLRILTLPGLLIVASSGLSLGDDASDFVRQQAAIIQAVGDNGTGHAAAVAAAKSLQSRGTAQSLLPLLKEMGAANSLAENWLEGTFETIAAREQAAGKKLPIMELEAFVKDVGQPAQPRRLAYEWLTRLDGTARDRLIPTMLEDPSSYFRRDAVQNLMIQAENVAKAGDKTAAANLYRIALKGATDEDQVKAIAKPLREQGEKVDLQHHFGFLTDWKLVGPFDNTDKSGFDVVYPPEQELLSGTGFNGDAKYPGKTAEVAWVAHHTEQEFGQVDLNQVLKKHMGAIGYTVTTFNSATERSAELRLGTENAWKMWVNGKLVFARDEYHRSTRMDQYRIPVKLRAGPNQIVLKVLQNEQTEDWAQDWKFQLRVCDSSGTGLHQTP